MIKKKCLFLFLVCTAQEFWPGKPRRENGKADFPLNFTSGLVCPSVQEGNLTWPETIAGEETYPEEFCFQADAFPPSRTCQCVNSVAKWSEVDATCEMQNYSKQTSSILAHLNSCNDTNLSSFIAESFSPLDVYVLYLVYTSIKNSGGRLDNFPQNFDAMMYLDRSLLKEAQVRMMATDHWLQFMSEALLSSTYFSYGDSGRFTRITIFNDKSFQGFLVQENNTLSALHDSVDLEFLLGLSDWQRAMLIDTITTQAALIHFTDDRFFVQNGQSKNVTDVFALLNADGVSLKPLIVRRIDDNSSSFDVQCLVWKLNLEEHEYGFWEEDGELEIISPFYICRFLRTGYFTVSLTKIIDITTTPVTTILETILESEGSASVIYDNLRKLVNRYHEFNSTDVDLVAQILSKLSATNERDLNNLVTIINGLYRIENDVLVESQMRTRATDSILYNIDRILLDYNEEYRSANRFTVLDNFTALIFDKTKFSALLLFKDNRYQDLPQELNSSDLLLDEDVESAFILPPDFKNGTENCSKLIVTIFLNDVLFNEGNHSKPNKSVSKIFGIVLQNVEKLTKPIPIFHQVTTSHHQDMCAHWSYNYPKNQSGFWKSNNKSNEFSFFKRCDFWHTTHFALLLLDEDNYKSVKALDYITLVTSSLSLFGLVAIILTVIIYKNFRSKPGNKILLQFALSCLVQTVSFYVASYAEDDFWCTLSGVVLHYSTISEFCWMLVAAVFQFRRFVTVFHVRPKRIVLKSALFAWCGPLLPVGLVLIFNIGSYKTRRTDLCYPSSYCLYFGVWLPICTVLFFNVIIFLLSIKSISANKNLDTKDALYKLRLLTSQFLILGLTWTFGFLAEINGGAVFAYLFCILASLQGFFLFLFFIVLYKKSRTLYGRNFTSSFLNRLFSQHVKNAHP